MRLNIYGKVAVVSAALGLGLLLVFGGPPYPNESIVLFAVSAITVAVAMYRNSPEDDEYPHDRDGGDDKSERERTREKDREYKKGSRWNWR